jgi:type 1 glutamine amidotransferase
MCSTSIAATSTPLLANLVVGSPARNHDFDFARRALLDVLYEEGGIRTDVFNSYDSAEAFEAGDLLVSYTSQVPVTEASCRALSRYLARGGRWFAIHASNSVLDNPHLPKILGSRFVAHPPYTRYRVTVSRPDDRLVAGIPASFEVEDELYVIEEHGDLEVLLEARWGGTAMSREFPETIRPLMYRHPVGEGAVVYLALGHCNRPFDKPRPDLPDGPDRRGPWPTPVYRELVRRGVQWAARRRPL